MNIERVGFNGMENSGASHLASTILDRISDEEQLETAINLAYSQSSHWFWNPPSLAGGESGIAVMHVAAHKSGQERVNHLNKAGTHLRAAVTETGRTPLRELGLASGIAGLAHAIRQVARIEPRFTPSLEALDNKLVERILSASDERASLPRFEDYDIISGEAGILMYLHTIPRWSERVAEAAEALTGSLVRRTLKGGRNPLDGFIIRPENYPGPSYLQDFPEGYINLGFAHGVPGVLAALSWGIHRDLDTPNLREGWEACLSFLLEFESPTGWGVGVPVDRSGRRMAPTPPENVHVGWCYGGAGVSTAILASGVAAGDSDLQAHAVGSFNNALNCYKERGLAQSGTFCHGHAGMVVLTRLFAMRNLTFNGPLAEMESDLETYFVNDSLMGSQDRLWEGRKVDDVSLLTGAAGMAAAALSNSLSVWAPLIGWAGDIDE